MSPVTESATPTIVPGAVTTRQPDIDDAVRMWEIARDSQVLDLNSSYAYLLWCRDFRDTSVVAEQDGRVGGFVTGFVRPEDPRTVFVWQVAVDESLRGRGVAAAMLNDLLDHLALQGVTRLETTISPGNDASRALFSSVARMRYVDITKRELFTTSHFPDQHESEELYIIGDDTTGGDQ